MESGRKYSLKCPKCSALYVPDTDHFTCTKCDAPTIVEMHVSESTPLSDTNDSSLWRYFNLLPLDDRKWIVSQSEGRTPLFDSPQLAKIAGIHNVLIKNETLNPTGAFKDRQISVGISKAMEAGAHTVAVVSSGNVAASAASYCAKAGIRCLVFTPSNAPDFRLVQARVYGADFYKVNTLSSSRIFELVSKACKEKGWHLLSTAGLYNPFQVEGSKTIAHELYEQTDALPDFVIAPVGGGGLLGGLWRGFKELARMGKIEKLPTLVGVQASACTPLLKAMEEGLTPKEVIENPVEVGETIAGAIADDILFDAYSILPAIRETCGHAIAVTDEEMLFAEEVLAKKAGIFAEPTSAATVAALIRMKKMGILASDSRACCVITGSGFKDMNSAQKIVDSPFSIEPTEEAFKKLD